MIVQLTLTSHRQNNTACKIILDKVSEDALTIGWSTKTCFEPYQWLAVTLVAAHTMSIELQVHASLQQSRLETFQQEACVHSKLKHPNIITLHGGFLEAPIHGNPDETCLVLEYATKGNLLGAMQDEDLKDSPCLQRLEIAKDVVCGLAYLHSCTPLLLHGDLKPGIVVMFDDGNG